ncbi:outer membrane beta-barrel protein [Pedobacter sp. BAL39]|uniref:outer membrane beta-barrel protein n=1 Tax=Pedobacter sp. BAL39 TaxID=391596 RepID=UPI0018DD0471|nr:outer membrane beta-barrel protein [Pedobacter sp. BAL39]
MMWTKSALAQNPAPFALRGLVMDQKNQPLPGASVSLIDMRNGKIFQKAVTDREGRFSVVLGKMTLRLLISYVGFNVYESDTILVSGNLNLDPIVLRDGKDLSEVSVKGQRTPPLIQATGGKIIYNVAAGINAQGSNVLEVLRKAPGVVVSSDNVIGIAGREGALVLLNGKQTYMQPAELADLLKSLPATNVKSIEVLNNPSAQYDAAGSGGIINIVLKKNENEGWNGTFSTGLGYGFSLKNNSALSFNYRQKKLNVFGNYSHNVGNFGLRYGMDRDESGTAYRGWSKDTDKRQSIASGLGLDYQLNDRHSIGGQLTGNFLFGGGSIYTNTAISDLTTGLLKNTLFSESDYYHQSSKRYNTNLNYRYEDTLGTRFQLDLDYGTFRSGTGNLQPNTYYLPDGSVAERNSNRILTGRDIDLYAFSGGYEQKLGAGKLSLGLKYSSVISGNLFDLYRLTGDSEELDQAGSNDFNFKERIFSSYVQYEHQLGNNLSLQAGMRLEQTNATGTLITAQNQGQQNGEIKRNYLNGFPSIALELKIDEEQRLSLIYGRRIDRPAYQDLNPFDQPLDGISSLKGNAYLLPQKTQRISLQYQLKKTIFDLSFSRIGDYFAQITDTLGADKVVMQPRNLGTQQQVALNLIQQIRLIDAWELSINALMYYKHNEIAFDDNRHFNLKRVAGSLNVQQTIRLPWQIKAELATVFNTKRLGGANDISRHNSQVDIGFQRGFMNDQAKVGLSFTDVFLGNTWDATSYYSGYYIRNYGYVESRQVKLNFSYNLGNAKIKAPKDKESGLKSETDRL